MQAKTSDGNTVNLGDYLVIDKSYVKDGLSGLMVADFNDRKEAQEFINKSNNPNYELVGLTDEA